MPLVGVRRLHQPILHAAGNGDLLSEILLRLHHSVLDLVIGLDGAYAVDIERIRAAFNTDSTAQREKLRSALRDTSFVMVIDAGNGKAYVAKPGDIYIATDRLQQLFSGVPGVLIVDNEYDCLRGEDIRDLLVSCGASRYLAPVAISSGLGPVERAQIRREAGLERASWESQPEDFSLRGLMQLLELLPKLNPHEAAARGKILWEALADLEARGTATFYGSYRWGYSHETKTARFDADFVQTLNETAWVPNADGELVRPGLIVFDTLGWKPNPFLQTAIVFKPPIIDQLARQAGIDPAALDLLRKLGITNVADLTSRLGISHLPTEPASSPAPEQQPDESIDGSDVYAGANDLYGDDMPDIVPGTFDPVGGDEAGMAAGSSGRGRSGAESPRGGSPGDGGGHRGSGGAGTARAGESGRDSGQGKRASGHAGGRPFISYLGTHPDDEDPDPDGLDQAARMHIEASAIHMILRQEPAL